MKALLGVDIGTQGTKASLFADDGIVLASAFRKSVLHQPQAGVVEEDPERQVATVCQTIRECVTKARVPSEVVAIGVAGQMAGILGVNGEGQHVTPYDSWLDTRCAAYIDKMNQTAADEIVAKTGGPASFNHGPKILWWLHERRAISRTIKAFVQPGGYVAMRLCGLAARQAFIDKTYLHFSGFADSQRGCWDTDLCRRFGLAPEKLPRIVAPQEVVGELTPGMARRCGLPTGVRVVAGCGDTAASFLSCGATREGICVDVAGTASVFAATTRRFCPDRRQKVLSCGHAATPGLWHPYAYINGGGMNLEWFGKHIAGANGAGRQMDFRELDRAASSIVPAAGLPFFVPHLGGRVSPSWPHLRGAWVGLAWDHTPAHLWRAMLEGIALEYAIYKRVLLGLDDRLEIKELRVTGGGEKSALWNQLKADALGTKVVQVNHSEGARLGAALVAGFGAGLIADLDAAARKWIRKRITTRPNRRLADYYRKRLSRYEGIMEALYKWSDH